MINPVLVNTLRGDVIENRHRGAIAVCDPQGRLLHAWGDVRALLYPRSSIKALQAIPVVESGAADHYAFTPSELALACSSHNAEPMHTKAVSNLLRRAGFDDAALECGVHLPLHEQTAHRLLTAGQNPGKVHNNCSGKHAGFLTVCRHLDLDPAGYLQPGHPVQAHHITKATEAACEVDLSDQTPVVDGCGIPIWGMPLVNLAQGWATLATTEEGQRLFAAMQAEPFMVAGTGRMCTRIMEASSGIAVKTGAEGVFCGVHPESGLAWALKARDGATRASEAAVLWLMRDLGFVVDVDVDPVRNHAGLEVGGVRVVA